MEETTWNKLCGRPPQYDPAPCNLSFDLLALKVLSESYVTWATFVSILFFLGLTVLDIGPCMRETDVRQTSDAHHRLMPPPCGGGGIISCIFTDKKVSHHLEGERGHIVSAHYGPHSLIHMIHLRQLMSEIAAKAHQRANSILRCFTSTYVFFLYLYVYVRPMLEYCSVVWSPCANKMIKSYCIDCIEKVQR